MVKVRPGAWTNAHLVTFGTACFIAANVLFAASLNWLPAALVWVGAAASIIFVAHLCQGSDGTTLTQPIQWRALLWCFAASVAVFISSGIGHLVYVSPDWLIRDAVLVDMVREGLPASYSFKGKDYTLRAPLGMYIVPALVGRVFGVGSAFAAMVLQNALLLAITLYLLAIVSRVGLIALVALFIAFSGWDVLFHLKSTGSLNLGVHIEGNESGLQYSSHVTMLFWVPNHALPGWWFVAVALLCARRELPLAILAILVAVLAFWSPLAMIGAVPIALALAAPRFKDIILSRDTWISGLIACAFIPVALYLFMDAGAVERKWLLFETGFFTTAFSFLVFELPHVFLLYILWSRIEPSYRGILIVSIVCLALLPTYSMGPSNDLLMRASIVPLAIIAFVFASQAVAVWQMNDNAIKAMVAATVLLGAVTPFVEFKRSFTVPTFAISSCNLLTAWSHLTPDYWMSNYMADRERVPKWLMTVESSKPPLRLQPMYCWPDHPVEALRTDEWAKTAGANHAAQQALSQKQAAQVGASAK